MNAPSDDDEAGFSRLGSRATWRAEGMNRVIGVAGRKFPICSVARSREPDVPGNGSRSGGGRRWRQGGRPLEESEGRLIERAKDGEGAAYEELVRRYQGIAFRVAYVITGSAAEAEDAAQEGFIRAYGALGRFRPGAPFRPWLIRIVSNVARNQRSARVRRGALALQLAGRWESNATAESPEAAALAEERRGELLTAINGLREDDRRVIACRYFLGLSESETAAALGCARGTVKSRLSRALGRLRLVLLPGPETVDGVGAGQGSGRTDGE